MLFVLFEFDAELGKFEFLTSQGASRPPKAINGETKRLLETVWVEVWEFVHTLCLQWVIYNKRRYRFQDSKLSDAICRAT